MATASVATYAGRAIIWNRVLGAGTIPKYIGWGDGASASVSPAAIVDVALFKSQTEARATGVATMTTTTFLGDTYQVVGSITAAVGAKTITEAGLFDSTTLGVITTVGVSMTAAQTSVSLGTASGIASLNYYRQIEKEVVLCTGGQNTTVETITRGRLGSTSAVHALGVSTTTGGDGGTLAGGGTTEQSVVAANIAQFGGGNLFAHADFGGIALAVSDSINFTWTDQLT